MMTRFGPREASQASSAPAPRSPPTSARRASAGPSRGPFRPRRRADTDARADGVPEAEVLGEEALRVESTAGAEAVLAATARLDIDPGAEPWAVARAPDERDLEPVRRRGDVSQQPVRPARERWNAP